MFVCVYMLALYPRKGVVISLPLLFAAAILCAFSSFSVSSQPCRVRIAASVGIERGRLPLCVRVSLIHAQVYVSPSHKDAHTDKIISMQRQIQAGALVPFLLLILAHLHFLHRLFLHPSPDL